MWLSPFFVWRERCLSVKGVCLVSFSSCLFFFVFNPQKRSRVAFLLLFGERWLLVKGASKASNVPSFSPSKASSSPSKSSKAFSPSAPPLSSPPPAPFDPWTFEGFEGFKGLVEEGSREPDPLCLCRVSSLGFCGGIKHRVCHRAVRVH